MSPKRSRPWSAAGVTNYQSAIVWGTVWTVVGAGLAAFVASALVNTFSRSLLQAGTVIGPTVTFAVLTGAMAWILFASRMGFPVSTTHALTGAIVGTGLVAFAGEELIWSAIAKKIALPLLLSPVLALTVSLLIHPAVRTLAKKWDGACLCVMPASRAFVAIDTHGGTSTLFQTARFSQTIMVQVPDTGCGISPDDLPHIFDRFFRAGTNHQDRSAGAGLGLAIAKRILELHGSDIEAQSILNGGTTFIFHLPVAQPSIEPIGSSATGC